MFDALIHSAHVIDGSGAAAFTADVAIREGVIAAVGQLAGAAAVEVIEADGRVLTPGFIDIHRHADAALFRDGFGAAELSQGLTTLINGNCGLSMAPVTGKYAAETVRYLAPITGEIPQKLRFASLKDYFQAAEERKLPLHNAMLIGMGTLRTLVSGFAAGDLDLQQERELHYYMEQALADGALGVSLGLGYAPEIFYSTDGLIRALAPLYESGVPLTVHMRQEGDGVVESLREMLLVGKALKTPLEISHLKAIGTRNWRKAGFLFFYADMRAAASFRRNGGTGILRVLLFFPFSRPALRLRLCPARLADESFWFLSNPGPFLRSAAARGRRFFRRSALLCSTRLFRRGLSALPRRASAAIGAHKTLRSEPDQILPACLTERLDHKVPELRTEPLQKRPLQLLAVRIGLGKNRRHIARVDAGIVHAGRKRPGRRVKILHLLGSMPASVQKLRQLHGILQRAARMRGHQIRHQILLPSVLFVHRPVLVPEFFKYVEMRFAHVIEHARHTVLRRDLELSGDVVLHKLGQKRTALIFEQVVVTDARARKDLSHARNAPQAAQQRDVLRVVRVEIFAGMRGKTVFIAAHAACELFPA